MSAADVAPSPPIPGPTCETKKAFDAAAASLLTRSSTAAAPPQVCLPKPPPASLGTAPPTGGDIGTTSPTAPSLGTPPPAAANLGTIPPPAAASLGTPPPPQSVLRGQAKCFAPPPKAAALAAAVVPKVKRCKPIIKSKFVPSTSALLADSPSVPSGGGGANLIFPSGYGFVVLTAVGSVMMVSWKSFKVGMARDEFKIPYPQVYTSDNVAFNCVLRAHQNTMENYPQFLLMLMIGGLEMPYFCTMGGCIWILGRIMYAKGYYTGDPNKRARGNVSVIGMVMLLAATAKFALKHLRG